MRFLVRIFNHFKPKEIPKPVGRWNNECNIKTNKKIDFSNEDHCGPCGYSNITNKEVDIYKINK